MTTEETSENRRASTLSEAYLKEQEPLELTDEERKEAREARKAERESAGNRRASSLSEEYERSLENE